MGYGGRRPGAGAPKACPEPGRRSNINGLRAANRTTRYYFAYYYVALIPQIRPYLRGARPGYTPAERRLFHRFLEAARWAIDANPDLSGQVEAILERHLKGRIEEQANLPLLRAIFSKPAATVKERLEFVLDMTAWAVKSNPALAADLTGYLLHLLQQAPDYPGSEVETLKKPQSSNQAIKLDGSPSP